MSDDAGSLEGDDGDEWKAVGITAGEYQRLHARIEAEGRDALTSEELAQHDGFERTVARSVRSTMGAVIRQTPDVAGALKRAKPMSLGPAADSWRQEMEERASKLAESQRVQIPGPDEEQLESLASAARAREDREVAQVEALELIAGHVAEMKDEQQETTASVQGLRGDGEKSGRWNIAGVILAGVAALFAVLTFLFR